MLNYENAEMEIIVFACEDVITTSSLDVEDGNLRPNELPIG